MGWLGEELRKLLKPSYARLCGRSVKTGRNRDWRLVMGMPTASYGAAIIVSSRFVSLSLSLSLSTHVSTLGIFLRSSYLLAGRCAAKRRNLISIKFYDCNESVAQRWRFRHATAKLSTSGPCYIARVTRFSRGNRGRIKFLWGRNGFDRKPGIGLSDRFFYSSAEGIARWWKNIP